MSKRWSVYILECGDGSLYTGITNDVPARILAHQEGRGAKYTKGRGPLNLKYQEECGDRSAASKREMAIKKLSRDEKMFLMT
ncbi:MAG: endonuclease [Micavibrio sp.]|nr:endonuclease [Micavibrio sp.]